jgi:ankyrin repeat protein
MSGHEVVVKLLLVTDGVDMNYTDVDGVTPLSWASRTGVQEVVGGRERARGGGQAVAGEGRSRREF